MTISYAKIDWVEGTPYSQQYNDSYFSKDGGISETHHIFIKQNCIEERLREGSRGDQLVIGEIGFGTGLNFLCVLDVYQKISKEKKGDLPRLFFITFEKHPLNKESLRHVHAEMPEKSLLAKELIDRYPEDFFEGVQPVVFEKGAVNLFLFLGDARESITALAGINKIDCWFMDAFGPKKNPELWSDDLLYWIARWSGPGTTFATFSVAGEVRRKLKTFGFEVEKIPGFGRKKEMLRAKFEGGLESLSLAGMRKPAAPEPWGAPPKISKAQPKTRVAVIGAGLAGSAVAFEFARRQCEVSVFEEQPQLAQGASGNPWAVCTPLIAAAKDALGDMTLSSYAMFQSHLKELEEVTGKVLALNNGALALDYNEDEAWRHDSAFNAGYLNCSSFQRINGDEARQIAGVDVSQKGVFFPTSLAVSPQDLCRKRLNAFSSFVTHNFNAKILRLEKTSSGWNLHGEEKIYEADVVIIANSTAALEFPQTNWIPLRKVRGQMNYISALEELKGLKTVLHFDGYVTPAWDINGKNCHLLGATYQNGMGEKDLKNDDYEDLMARLELVLKKKLPREKAPHGRVSFRGMSPDMRPVVGAIPDESFFEKNYSDLFLGRNPAAYPPAEYIPDLYVSLGLGSRGLIYSVLAAKTLVAQVFGEPIPLFTSQYQALNPSRFLVKKYKRHRKYSGI